MISQLPFAIFAAMLISFTSLGIQDHAWAKENLGLKIVQKSKITGTETTYVTSEGLRVENARARLLILAQAPNCTVFKCDLTNKHYVSIECRLYQNRLGRSQALFGGTTLRDATVKRSAASTWHNTSVEVYSEDKAFKLLAAKLYREKHEVTGDYPIAFTLTTLAAGRFPKQLAHILCSMHDLPTVDGIPLKLYCEPFDQKKYFYLDTYEINSIMIPNEFFNIPQGFSKIKSEGLMTGEDPTLKDFMKFMH